MGGVLVGVSPCFLLPPFIISLIVSPLSILSLCHDHNIFLSAGFLIFLLLFHFLSQPVILSPSSFV